MHNLPWFPFYGWDWFSSMRVRMMGPVARAYYLELLRTQWDEGSIPQLAPACQECRNLKRDMCDKCRSARLEPVKRLLQMPQERTYEGLVDGLDYDAILLQVLTAFIPDGKGLVNQKLKRIREEQLAFAQHNKPKNQPVDPSKMFEVKRRMVEMAAHKGMP